MSVLFDGPRIVKLFAWLHGVHINSDQISAVWGAISKLYNGTRDNGDFFKWLIEHGPEIIALAKAIIAILAMFAESPVAEAVEQYDGLAEMKELL